MLAGVQDKLLPSRFLPNGLQTSYGPDELGQTRGLMTMAFMGESGKLRYFLIQAAEFGRSRRGE